MYKRVQIDWLDCYSPDLDMWRTVSDAIDQCVDPMLCTTIGFIIHDAPAYLIIADTIAWYETSTIALVRGLLHIPKGSIKQVIDL